MASYTNKKKDSIKEYDPQSMIDSINEENERLGRETVERIGVTGGETWQTKATAKGAVPKYYTPQQLQEMANYKNISRNERPSWYVPGKTSVEQQHVSEHERLQTLQKLALNGKTEELVTLLNTFPLDKQGDLLNMIEEIKDDKHRR